MAYNLLTFALLLTAVSPAAAVVRQGTSATPITPRRGIAAREFLVEYTGDLRTNVSYLQNLFARLTVQAASDFYSEVGNKGLRIEPKLDITSELFHGSSFKLDDEHNEHAAMEEIDALPIVKKVWRMRHYYPQGVAATRSKPQDLKAFPPHVMTGVDKLHAQGYTGQGRHIAILDTGVDYNLFALGNGFGPGFKVTNGYDFVGNDYDGTNTPVDSGPNPYTNCSSHGTHVAGIIGAKNSAWNITGSAPDATLSMYKVFGCDGSVQDDILIKATLAAFEERPDAISISIGGKNGWTEGRYLWFLNDQTLTVARSMDFCCR